LKRIIFDIRVTGESLNHFDLINSNVTILKCFHIERGVKGKEVNEGRERFIGVEH
jgi:hypothetical protein